MVCKRKVEDLLLGETAVPDRDAFAFAYCSQKETRGRLPENARRLYDVLAETPHGRAALTDFLRNHMSGYARLLD